MPILDVIASDRIAILEVGFGNGNFLGWCGDSVSADLFGIELSAELCDLATSKDIQAYASFDELGSVSAGKSFDLIAAFSLIEHIESNQLSEFFCHVAKNLKPGGYFVGVFPNGDSPFGRVYQNADVTHVSEIGRGKLSYYVEESNLELVSIQNPKSPFLGVSLKRKLYKVIRDPIAMLVGAVLNFLYQPTTGISYDPNYICVVRKPRS